MLRDYLAWYSRVVYWTCLLLHFRKIVYNDLVVITPEQYFKQITKRVAEIKAVSVSIAIQRKENLDNSIRYKSFQNNAYDDIR